MKLFSAGLKTSERGCVVLDQPQPVANLRCPEEFMPCCGWSATQPRSFFRPALTILLGLLAAGWSTALAAPPASLPVLAERRLLVDACSTPVAAGKATLTIGVLERTNGIYRGDYKLRVFPYFLKNDKGRLAIVVSDETLAELNQGKMARVIGTATTSSKSGHSREIEATATPTDLNHGRLKLWFTAGERKLVFEPAYHFTEPGPPTATNLAGKRI